MTTGFHGFHVLVGTIALSVSFARMVLNHYTNTHHFGFEAAIWYWHFVNFLVKKAKLQVFCKQFSQSLKCTRIGRWFWFFLLLGFLTSGSPEFTLCDEVNSGPTTPATNAAAPTLTWAEICKEGVAACVIGYLVSNGTPAGFVVSTPVSYTHLTLPTIYSV